MKKYDVNIDGEGCGCFVCFVLIAIVLVGHVVIEVVKLLASK